MRSKSKIQGRQVIERWKYIIVAATVLSFFITLSASVHNWVSNTFFSPLKGKHPNIALFGAHAAIFVFGVVVLSFLGFILEIFSHRRKWKLEENEKAKRENEKAKREKEKADAFAIVKAWCDREIKSIVVVLKKLNHEVEIELQYYDSCLRKQGAKHKEYDWNRWERIAFICDLLRKASGLYNLDDNPEILEYVKRYPTLLPIAHLQATIRQGLDQIYESLCNKAAGNIAEMYKANVLLVDVGDWHVKQLNEYVEHLS